MPIKTSPLPLSFYQTADILTLSKQLIGKYLFTHFQEGLTGGMIVETEAYKAPEDKASHAYAYKKTPRNEVMYERGGVAYIYLCYGLHHLFNIVSYRAGEPHAILIRAIEPLEGIEIMKKRRGKKKVDRSLCGGPGALSQALGIDKSCNGMPLDSPQLFIEDRGHHACDILASPRVGIAYAKEYAVKPWRFRIKKCPWTSPAK